MAHEHQRLRLLDSRLFSEDERVPRDFRAFFEQRAEPSIAFSGRKLADKRRLAMQMIHQLIMTGLVQEGVADSRDNTLPGVRMRAEVWTAICDAGFAQHCNGSELSGKQSRYGATSQLLNLRHEWELQLLVDTNLARNTELPNNPTHLALVVLHTGRIDLATGLIQPEDMQKQPISLPNILSARAERDPEGQPYPEAIRNGLSYWREREDLINRINGSNLEHWWRATSTNENGKKTFFQPNPCIREVHSGRLHRAVRGYSWSALSGQNLPKATRRTMLIDGEPTAELDFSCMAIRMLYHLNRLDPKGDLYRPEQVFPKFLSFENVSKKQKAIVRDFVKRATNICLNVASGKAADGAVMKALKGHAERDLLRNLIYDVEGMKPADLVLRIMEAHPDVSKEFFREVGLDLMTTDWKVMLRILTAFADAGKPVLGIHDSVVCRASDAEFARKTMRRCYRKVMLMYPVIKRAY